MDSWLNYFIEETARSISPLREKINKNGRQWLTANPWLAPVISLIPVFGIFAYLLLQQKKKAALLLLLAYDLVPLLLFPIYFPYKLLLAVDTWTLAKRVQSGTILRDWEWFWTK